MKTVRDVHTAVSKLKPPKPASAAGGGAKVVDCFVESMGAWLEQSGAILEQLREQLKRTTRVFGVCARRVCADANDGPEVLYGRLATFRMQWRDASAENAAAAARAAREAWLRGGVGRAAPNRFRLIRIEAVQSQPQLGGADPMATFCNVVRRADNRRAGGAPLFNATFSDVPPTPPPNSTLPRPTDIHDPTGEKRALCSST